MDNRVLFCWYLSMIHCILMIESKALKFETASTASQFIHLENLIGSLHTYVADSNHLLVRDMGLTNGQKKLLERYDNIQVIHSTDAQSENTRKVDVHHEFILMNDTLYERSNQGKFIYSNLIRKRFHLAIVIPFIQLQFNRIIDQLKLNELFSPCYNHSTSIDLIFYHNAKENPALERQINEMNHLNQCYHDIYHIYADLSTEEDHYPIGSANMWKKLFVNEQSSQISLRARGYTHFFLMEPDTRPIRSYWLDAIVEQLTNGRDRESYMVTKWWMIGSIYRGSEPIGNDFLHINGNALYHLSFDFIQFIENVSFEYPYDSPQSMGYDLDLFLYLFKHIEEAKNHWHKFQFTDFVQNCWHTGCNDKTIEFIHNNPNTYLIHGYKIQQSNRENPSKKLYGIVLFGLLFLLVFKRLRSYYRGFFCKRSVITCYLDICKRGVSLQR